MSQMWYQGVNLAMEDPNKIFRVLIKFMDEQHVDSFLKEGLIFMNNINFFKSYEDSDVALRGDVHEGMEGTYKPDEVTITLGGHTLERIEGKVVVVNLFWPRICIAFNLKVANKSAF